MLWYKITVFDMDSNPITSTVKRFDSLADAESYADQYKSEYEGYYVDVKYLPYMH